MLHIVIVLIHLILGLGKQRVLAKLVNFDLQGCISGPLAILRLHPLLASHSHGHLLSFLLVHGLSFLQDLRLVLDDDLLPDALEV